MTITTTAATEAATQFPSSFRDCERIIVQELADVLDHMDETQIDALVNLIANARKVFFVGVGRVELALEAIAKRLAHLGVDTVMVGQITEPAICGQDLLIVGSGSGKTGFPLFIAGKAKSFGAKVARIGIVEDCPMKQYTDLFVHVPAAGKPGSGSVTKLVNNMIAGAIMVAIAEGYALTEDEAAEIDTAVESYRTYGKSIGFATLNKFLSAYFGTGNSEKTIRANMAEELIASRYADDVYASFTYTDDEIDAYYAENADSYDRVNVLYTLISAAANEDEGIDADTAKAAAEDKAKDATERTARLQADWENFRRRTANERIAERERATEKLVTALLPVIDDIERAIDHARSQELSDDFKQFVDGVDAVHAKLLDVFAHEGVEPIDPKGEAFDPLEHQAVGRVEDASQYDETVNDVYQKGYRMADRILRSAMVTVTYGGEKRPAPEPEAAPEDAAADTAESTEE